MWIALGLIGMLWLVGAVISPDPNAPQSQAHAPPAVAAAPAPTITQAPPERP